MDIFKLGVCWSSLLCLSCLLVYAYIILVDHTFTNIVGKDRDVGYAILRISREQRWTKVALGNPLFAALLALTFEHGVMLHNIEIEQGYLRVRGKGDADRQRGRHQFRDRHP